MNYYERHLGDYARDTAHLTMLEHGAYGLLLDRYYATERGIPVDQAHRVARARTREERAAVDAVLAEFFTLADGILTHGRVQREIEKAQSKIKAARENGMRGGRPKRNPTQTDQEPTGLLSGSDSQTQTKAHQTPDTRHQTPKEENGGIPPEPPARKRAREAGPQDQLPGWVDATAWDGYEAMRKAVRKPMTPAARRLAVAELAKLRDAGHDPTEVLRQSTFRSWVGLFPVKADAVQPGVNGRAPVGAMSEHGLQTMRNAKALEARLFGAKTPEKVEEVGDGA